MTRTTKKALPAVLFAVLLPALALLGQGTAQAADGYRYWSFWEQKNAKWAYATQGPSVLRPADGDVIGFRFAVSEDSKDANTPRGTAQFDTVCGRTKDQAGAKRIAVSVDFGTAADAPKGETPPRPLTGCARVAQDATAAEALAGVAAPLRYNSASLLCAAKGYPKSGCGEQLSGGNSDDSSDSSAGKDDSTASGGDGGLPAGVGIGAAVVVVAGLAGAAVWQARRRRE